MTKAIVIVAFWLLFIVGEILCLVKFVKSDFKAPYKREAIYGISLVTGFGVIVGYLNIEDN